MPRFRYSAYTTDGRRDDGTVEFTTEAQAWESLSALGLTVVALELYQGADRAKPAFSANFSKRIPMDVQADLAEQLSVLFSAHLQVTEVVNVIEKGAERSDVKQLFSKLGRQLADGTEFPLALEQAGNALSPLFITMVKVGHATADMVPMLRSLASYLRRQERLQAQLSAALIYPLILTIGAIGLFLLMVLYLAPSLEPMFVSLDRPVPPAIEFFLLTGRFLVNYGFVIGVAFVLIVAGASFVVRRSYSLFQNILLHVPVIGPIVRASSLARLTHSLNLMLNAGIPLEPALKGTAQNLKNEVFATAFADAAKLVEGGGAASDAFETNSGLPSVFRELFSIGERTNTLPAISASLAAALADQVERLTAKATLLITPVLTLLIGGGIGLIVYSVMSAILSVNDLAF